MLVSLDILIDNLSQWNCDIRIPNPTNTQITRTSMLPENYYELKSDLLYVCKLSEALAIKAPGSEINYLCLRDRIADGAETEEMLSGMIIVNENISYREMFEVAQTTFFRVNEWRNSMREAFINNEPVQKILDLSEDMIGNTINLSDAAFSLIATTKNIEKKDEISLNLMKYGYHPESTMKRFHDFERFDAWKTDIYVIKQNTEFSTFGHVGKIFRFNNTYYEHVVMCCDHRPLTSGLISLFKMMIEVLELYSRKSWENTNNMSRDYNSFLTDLFSGKITDSQEISFRAKTLRIPETWEYCVLRITNSAVHQITLGKLAKEIANHLHNYRFCYFEDSIVIILFSTSDILGNDKSLSDLISSYNAQCGTSDIFYRLSDAHQAYLQACVALQYYSVPKKSRLLPEETDQGERSIFDFQDHVIYYMLNDSAIGDNICRSSKYYKGLEKLKEYDKRHLTNNFQLLYVYLYCNKNTKDASSILHMHRNNVLYRIERISEMLNMNLDDYHVLLGLGMAYLHMELHGEDIVEKAQMTVE